jgi:CRISPR system Cascade subunit CasC
MVADDTNLNVDAAVQVAHAIGVDSVETEFDYFVAVDDCNDSHDDEDDRGKPGAGMIGNVEYDSSTFYRYENISLAQLNKNLVGDKEYERIAVINLINAFIESMPSGKQNTFAAQTLPSTVIVEIRDSRPISYVGAFEKPVKGSHDHSITENATTALKEYVTNIDDNYGAPSSRFIIDLTGVFDGEKVNASSIAVTVADKVFAGNED